MQVLIVVYLCMIPVVMHITDDLRISPLLVARKLIATFVVYLLNPIAAVDPTKQITSIRDWLKPFADADYHFPNPEEFAVRKHGSSDANEKMLIEDPHADDNVRHHI